MTETPTPRDLRLDVLAAWRAIEAEDLDAAYRIFAVCSDPGAAFVQTLRLCSLLTRRWLHDSPGAVDALIDRLVAEELREEVDRL